jgi:GNAT superfamily N-acetyltransferase
MTPDPVVRRVRLHEWESVRGLRLEAVRDPDAAIAFLSTPAEELARDDAFWQERAAGGALGENSAQFIAADGRTWVGTATVLVREAASLDHLGRVVERARADVVGVYVSPAHRGTGLLARLLDAAAEWARAAGLDVLSLDVHADNARAQAAYRRAGFAPTGVTFTSVIGPELEMARPLS